MSSAKGRQGRTDEPQPLASVLDALGAERRLGAGLLLGSLGRSWDAVVGERLAEESIPAALDDGVLLVRASSSAWAAQIRFLAGEIREGANRALGASTGGANEPIREVRVVVDPAPRTP